MQPRLWSSRSFFCSADAVRAAYEDQAAAHDLLSNNRLAALVIQFCLDQLSGGNRGLSHYGA